MNREIKFEYGFSSVNGIVKKVYHLHEIPSIKEKCDVWNVLPIHYVRQFTGLKDKNGVDIYEGDVLDSVGIVEYVDGCFMASGVPLALSSCHRFIKGNRYENPELLNQ